MHRYVLADKTLEVHLLESSKVHPRVFSGSARRFKKVNRSKIAAKIHNSGKGINSVKLLRREEEKRKKIKALGMDYEFPGYKGSLENENKEEKNVEKKITKTTKKKRKRK